MGEKRNADKVLVGKPEGRLRISSRMERCGMVFFVSDTALTTGDEHRPNQTDIT